MKAKVKAVSENGYWSLGKRFSHDEQEIEVTEEEYQHLLREKHLVVVGHEGKEELGPEEPIKGIPRDTLTSNMDTPTLQSDSHLTSLKHAVAHHGIEGDDGAPTVAEAQAKLQAKGQHEQLKAIAKEQATLEAAQETAKAEAKKEVEASASSSSQKSGKVTRYTPKSNNEGNQ